MYEYIKIYVTSCFMYRRNHQTLEFVQRLFSIPPPKKKPILAHVPTEIYNENIWNKNTIHVYPHKFNQNIVGTKSNHLFPVS